MFFTNSKNDTTDRFKIFENMNTAEMSADTMVSILESMIDVDETLTYVSEGAASWEAMKVVFGDYKKNTKKIWAEGKKLEREGKYKEAVKKYDEAIAEAKKVYKVVDSIPDENIYDFLVGFIPYISYALWGIILVGTFMDGSLQGASRAYARKCVDSFIKGLTKKRNECASKK